MMIHNNIAMSKNINDFVSSEVIEYLERSDSDNLLLKQEIEMLKREIEMYERHSHIDPQRCSNCKKLGYDIGLYRLHPPRPTRDTDLMLRPCGDFTANCCNKFCVECVPTHMHVYGSSYVCVEHKSYSDSEE